MSIPSDDRGLTLGDGLFETVLARDGVLVGFERHTARLRQSCETIGLPPPSASQLRDAALAALEDAGPAASLAAVRLTLTAGSGGRGLPRPAKVEPRLIATASAFTRPSGPARLITSTIRRNQSSPAARLKTLSYMDNVLARREADAAGADEAVMLNTSGQVACATTANIFWRTAGQLFTPALEAGVLAGVARAEIIDGARAAGLEVEEVIAAPDALASADAVFLTNSLIGARAVALLDGRALPDQQVEQITEWLSLGRR